MVIKGMIKTSLLDYPGRISAVLFTGGCNMRCVYCHNSSLVLNPGSEPSVSETEVFSFLQRRRNLLQGVVVTGGEPTLYDGLRDFLLDLKAKVGLPVKLDTNGTNPDMLCALLSEKLVSYVAMDVKSDFQGYSRIAGVNIDTDAIKKSIQYLIKSGIPYEFRTTVVKEYFDRNVAENIGEMLEGAERYYLQQFRMCKEILGLDRVSLNPCSKKEMLEFKQILEPHIAHVELRGVD